ncbi:hypothetical protein [Robiginitalea sp. SC105]|uniref:hypothetical protein n=1 Tax=Robiginitalea sp. SC105 TaxID=2762332 RepID=UPI001639671B|nr:hypothetical protein [Robiginitalea sp. SC105]MBC2837714.1 hypothetical protein [Robiginitalea sp. SC105]
MSYKIKSLLYFLAFVASALIYYNMDHSATDPQPASSYEIAADDGAQELPADTF